MATQFGLARAVARSVMGDLIGAGYTQRGIERLLKLEGIVYPHKTFVADWRESLGISRLSQLTKYIPKKYKPSDSFFVPKASPIGSNYNYVYETTWYNSSTGNYESYNYTLASDRKLTLDEAEGKIMSTIMKEGYNEDLEFTGIEINTLTRKIR